MYAVFVAVLRTGIAASLLRLSTAARHGCHGSSQLQDQRVGTCAAQLLGVMQSAGKLSGGPGGARRIDTTLRLI